MTTENNLETVLTQPVPWLDAGPGHEIVVSTRVRLARNLSGHAFPGRAADASAAAVLAEVLAASESIAPPPGLRLPMDELRPADRQALFEQPPDDPAGDVARRARDHHRRRFVDLHRRGSFHVRGAGVRHERRWPQA